MLQPPTPPPTMTTRACVGKSDAMRRLLEPCAPLWVADPLRRTMEVLLGVIAEIEVELGNAALQQAPHRLAHVGGNTHELQARPVPIRRLAGVLVQEAAVLAFIEIMVAGEVGQVEEDVAHPGVLPVEDAQRAVVEEIGVEQVVVAGARPRLR